MGLTYTDIFCGAGGSSIGLTEAGLELRLAANHWARAIETHSANFPWAEHLCADVSNYEMRRLPPTDILWASPICTENSPAGGRKRRPKGQLDLLEEAGHVPHTGMERTRATFHDVIRATEVHRYKAVIVENVTEAADWELFDWWVHGMTILRPGYNVQFVSVSSAHVGGEANPHAPQWRDRWYGVFTRKGIPLPDVSPRPLAWCPSCEQAVEAFQAWKRPGRKIGKYSTQYVYCCPNTACGHARAEPFVLPVASAIDWDDLGTPIGDRKKTPAKPEGLAPATMARVRAGLAMAGGAPGSVPFLALLRSGRIRNWHADDAPLAAIMASGSNHALVLPGASSQEQRHATGPLAAPFLVKNYGGYCPPARNVTRVDRPMSVVTASDHHALVVPYRRGIPATTGTPLHTLATRESAALVQPDSIDPAECRLRMLKPREHLRAQRFPDGYVVKGNQGEQTMQAGNAVSAHVANWLGRAIAAVLG